MKLYGTIDTEVNVNTKTILKAAVNILYNGYLHKGWKKYTTVLEPGEKVNDSDRRWLFKVEDVSHYGNPSWEYTPLTDDENVINDFLLAQELEKVIERENK